MSSKGGLLKHFSKKKEYIFEFLPCTSEVPQVKWVKNQKFGSEKKEGKNEIIT